MNKLLLQILDLAAALGVSLANGKEDVASILAQIGELALQAYELNNGKTLDPSLIKDEEPV